MKISEYGFSVPANEAVETAEYRRQIARMAGLAEKDVIDSEVALLVERIRDHGQLILEPLSGKYFGRCIGIPGAVTTLQYLMDAFVGKEAVAISYGTAMGFYQNALRAYVQRSNSSESHRALLAGAACAISMLEFAAGVRSVIPNADCLTVDIEPTDKPQNSSPGCSYQTVDVRNLPFRQKFDSIHTTGVLDYLVDSSIRQRVDSPELVRGRQQFFEGAAKALKPGGILVMVERPISLTVPPIFQPFIGELYDAGFTTVALNRVEVFETRRHLHRYLQGTALAVSPSSLSASPFMGITARV